MARIFILGDAPQARDGASSKSLGEVYHSQTVCLNYMIEKGTIQEVITASLESFQRYGYGLWVLLSRQDRGFRGMCGLREGPPAGPELLFSVPAQYWGSGIATESAQAVLRYAFEELGLDYVTTSVDKPNVASIQVLEKLRFSLVEEKLIDENQIVSYAISRPDIKRARP